MWETITFYVVVLFTTALVIYDVWVIFKKGVSASISRVMYVKATQHPMIPFLIGGVMAHLFWPNC